MSNSAHNISHEEIVELQKKFSEIKFAIINDLGFMAAFSEMAQRSPDYSEKLASVVLTKASLVMSSLQEFTQALEKAGPELQEKFREIKHAINIVLEPIMGLSEMSQRRPEFSEKLESVALTVMSSLQEFTQALKKKAGPGK